MVDGFPEANIIASDITPDYWYACCQHADANNSRPFAVQKSDNVQASCRSSYVPLPVHELCMTCIIKTGGSVCHGCWALMCILFLTALMCQITLITERCSSVHAIQGAAVVDLQRLPMRS